MAHVAHAHRSRTTKLRRNRVRAWIYTIKRTFVVAIQHTADLSAWAKLYDVTGCDSAPLDTNCIVLTYGRLPRLRRVPTSPQSSFRLLHEMRLRPARIAWSVPRMLTSYRGHQVIRRLFRYSALIGAVLGLMISVVAWRVSYWGVFVQTCPYQSTYSTSLCSGFVRASWEAKRGSTNRRYFGKAALHLSQAKARWIGIDWMAEVSMRNPISVSHSTRSTLSRYPTLISGQGWAHINIPLWITTLIFAICSYPAFVAFRRRRRARHGCCPTCGYDLRGSPEGACSECGRER
jgi:hypothetical protein